MVPYRCGAANRLPPGKEQRTNGDRPTEPAGRVAAPEARLDVVAPRYPSDRCWVWIAHFALLPPEVDRGIFEFIPRGWPWFTAGQIIALVGSQLMLFGAAMIWVANQPLTWARTAFASFLTWIEFVLLFGVVPSEWLNLSQGPLGWTSQNIAFTIPPMAGVGQRGPRSALVRSRTPSPGATTSWSLSDGSLSPTCSRIGQDPPRR